MPQDRDRRLGRDAVDLTLDVTIEHDIADDEHAELREAAFEQGEDGVEVGEHAVRYFRRCARQPDHGAEMPGRKQDPKLSRPMQLDQIAPIAEDGPNAGGSAKVWQPSWMALRQGPGA